MSDEVGSIALEASSVFAQTAWQTMYHELLLANTVGISVYLTVSIFLMMLMGMVTYSVVIHAMTS